MILRDMLLATLVGAIRGFAIVAAKVGLESISAPQLAALRFVVAVVPIAVLARLAVPWSRLIAIGMTLFAGQFLLLFLGFEFGMPPGVASVTPAEPARRFRLVPS